MHDTQSIIIIGASGHAKVVLSTLLAAGRKVVGFVDDNVELHGREIFGYPVLGTISLLKSFPNQAVIFGVGNNPLRKTLAKTYVNLNWQTVVHPQAYVHSSVLLGEGTVVFAGAVIQPDTKIGKHVIVNTAVTIDHDCMIEDFAHVAPGCNLAGKVTVGEGSFIGIGSCIIQAVAVGKWSIVGAGSVVVKEIAAHIFAKGTPAEAYKKILAT